MNTTEARRLLGVGPETAWPAVRAAHRQAIRRAHPDAGGSAAMAARINQALDVLRRASTAPGPTAPSPTPVSAEDVAIHDSRPADVDHFFVVAERPESLLSRLADAGHEIGEVVFVDPHVGLLEIVVGEAPNVGQLAVTVGPEIEGGTSVAFTLDALGVDPAPPISGVVAALMSALAGR